MVIGSDDFTAHPVFNITNRNKIFLITIAGQWNSKSAEKTINEIKKLLELRSQNDIELHVEQDRKKETNVFENFSISSLDTFKNEILEELKMQKTTMLKTWYKECN